MAAETITAANVRTSNATPKRILAGVALTQGQTIAKDATTKKAILADANGSADAKVTLGVTTNAAAADQWVEYENEDPDFTPGFAVQPGQPYVQSATAGGICLAADLAAGHAGTFLGIGKTTTKLNLKIIAGGAVV